MATYRARVVQEGSAWVASAIALPNCWSRAATRAEALAKLREEIRYRIEYCPCTGVDDAFVQVEVQDEAPTRDAAPRAAGTVAAASAAPRPAELSGVAGCPGPRRRTEPGAPASGSGWKRWDD